jgi:hypothetical protein
MHFQSSDFASFAARTLIAALMSALILFTSCPLVQAEGSEPQHASADDCKIIVAIARKSWDWSSSAAPAYDFYPEFDDYIEDCKWSEFGVAAPRLGNDHSAKRFYITRPAYDGATATAEIHTYWQAENENHPFLRGEKCTLERKDGGWSVVSCKELYIT